MTSAREVETIYRLFELYGLDYETLKAEPVEAGRFARPPAPPTRSLRSAPATPASPP